jgi:hypothetical protein
MGDSSQFMDSETRSVGGQLASVCYTKFEKGWGLFRELSRQRESHTTIEGKPSKSDIFPESIDVMTLNKYLGGSSGVRAGYYRERLLVVKQARAGGLGELLEKGQIIEEYIADSIYSTLGFPTPFSQIYNKGEYKTSVFVPGKDLNCFPQDSKEYEQIKEEVKKGYVLDCFLANWDVIGTARDNIRLGVDGKVYRIDNGGSLRYRARGAVKGSAFASNVVEIDTMKERNPILFSITQEEIFAQIDALLGNREKIFKALNTVVQELSLEDDEYRNLQDILKLRLQYLEQYRKQDNLE